MSEPDLDVVVFGATGVTGHRVAAYLSEQSAQTGARWAAAARDAGKLERMLAKDGVSGAETIVADLGDPASLARIVSRTRVVLNLVGPYTLYARPMIEACITGGAHYLDLTGEIPFVRQVIDDFDGRAKDANVKLAQVSGFEALPPDLAVLLAAETARERWDEGLVSADLEVATTPPPRVPRPSDVVSGGTMQSLAVIVDRPDAAVAADPAALIDDPASAGRVRAVSPIEVAPRRGERGAVIAPMSPSAFINPAVIQRTAALLAAEAGTPFRPFRYREGVAIRGPAVTLPLRYAVADMLSGTQALMRAAMRARPGIRHRAAGAMRAILPGSGFGPKGDRVEGWSWGMSVDALTTGGKGIRVDVAADGHPGYLTTARMLGEAGLLLAERGATPDRSGCLTPATALGTGCLSRLERAHVRFSVGA
ncbi:MAG TPA: saccharopine dehydrogenase NADP-binding domain-containing protein [Solirubrobacterales bacterium]|nr:saccharopine dehydrogenase NADP-binding domain-containing protein [Solirubrobacterales bacterium]